MIIIFIQNIENIDRHELTEWLHRFIHLNTFEISIPGLKDASLVPENKSGMIVSFLAEYRLFEKLKNKGWYDEIRQLIENMLIEILNTTVYKGFREKIVKQFSFTPLSIRERTCSSEGGIVGWSFELASPVENKIQSAGKSVYTAIPNVFQAGQWAYSPAGVPMSILTGKFAADAALKAKKVS